MTATSTVPQKSDLREKIYIDWNFWDSALNDEIKQVDGPLFLRTWKPIIARINFLYPTIYKWSSTFIYLLLSVVKFIGVFMWKTMR